MARSITKEETDTLSVLTYTANSHNPAYLPTPETYPLSSSFPPPLSMMCCAVLPTSFGERDLNWGNDWQQSLQRVISSLLLCDWSDTRGKWLLARYPDWSCWQRYTSIKLCLVAICGSVDNRTDIWSPEYALISVTMRTDVQIRLNNAYRFCVCML